MRLSATNSDLPPPGQLIGARGIASQQLQLQFTKVQAELTVKPTMNLVANELETAANMGRGKYLIEDLRTGIKSSLVRVKERMRSM